MIDNFSINAAEYLKFRPNYPNQIFDYLDTITKYKQDVWDCGTGNGQVASKLINYFANIYATDISEIQLKNAIQNPKIHYTKQAAEQTNFPDSYFDLIIVAQAIHWFNFDLFYREARRTSKKDAIIAILGYGLVDIDKNLNKIIDFLYSSILGNYWDKERKYIEQNYTTIPFPFKEIQQPQFVNYEYWTLEHFIGYLSTWSSVKKYIQQQHKNPITIIYNDLKKEWGKDTYKTIKFPILMRVAYLHN
jgi:ubiquinone/menaquinone biosynthesis C-methylase UbiE